MGRHPGAYRGEKRRKEEARLKKQAEKRQRRLQQKLSTPKEDGTDNTPGEKPE